MRPNANIIKTYWQAMDANGKVYLFSQKPELTDGNRYTTLANCTACFLYPINLKPLQIAEIKVNENGTWSYEIEREEGWYWAKWHKGSTSNGGYTVINYKGGVWRWLSLDFPIGSDLHKLDISNTRIPDECII